MYKVLVVDDDHLVRKGFIAMMPWHRHGFEVVGEAGNGSKALEFLRDHPIDLLITDLEMPVMSGVDLMRQVKALYPNMYTVVLTFHEEFEFVQEALRLGALDYITKIELEHEQMDEVLTRIAGRIREQASRAANRSRYVAADHAYSLASVGCGEEDSWMAELCNSLQLAASRLEDGLWWIEGEGDEESALAAVECALASRPAWACTRWTGTRGIEREWIYQALRGYREGPLYYLYRKDLRRFEHSVEWLRQRQAKAAKPKLSEIGGRWLTLDWMIDDAAFQRMTLELAERQLPATWLESLFYAAVGQWERMLAFSFGEVDFSRFRCWQDWVDWLGGVRRSVQGSVQKFPYSEEVTASIMKSVEIIRSGLQGELHLPEVASEVNMSRSYFSRCFRDIVGRTFHEYVRDLRIDHAKALLRQTNRSIGWVAAQSGYPNEKYFAKVFRELTGMLPSEFRKREGGHISS